MPRLDNIERFKEILYALGSEPQVSSRRAETREDDLAAPATQPAPGPAFADETPDASTETSALDLDDLLGQTPENPAAASVTEAPADTDLDDAAFGFDEPAAVGTEGLDLGGLFDEGAAEVPSEEQADIRAPADLPDDLGALGGFGDTSDGTPEPSFGDLSAEPEGLPEPVAEPTMPERELALPQGDSEAPEADTDFGGLDFGEPAATESEPESAAEASGEPGPGPGGSEDADFGAADFGDLSGAFDEGAGEPAAATPDELEEPAADATGEGFPETPAQEFPEGPDAGEQPFETFGEEAAALDAPGEEAAVSPEAGELEGGAFDLGGFDTEGLGAESAATVPTESIDELAEGFSLQGLSDDLDQAVTTPAPGGEAPAGVDDEERTGAAPAGDVSLEDREFRALQRNLEGLPRNLKIAIETLVGEQGYIGEHLRPLLNMLVRGESRAVATLVGKITGTTIRIPARFERQTGAAFEEERGSFAYLFRTSVLPILRTVVLVALALVSLVYGGLELVVKPLQAEGLYRGGYRLLAEGEYNEAEGRFAQATEKRQVKGWYFRYAEAYTGKRKYQDASRKYDQLLNVFGYDKKAILDHARLQSLKLASYAKARELLTLITDKDFFDRDALIANGDNYLEWARHASVEAAEGVETRSSLLEEARLEYARVLERHGYETDVLLRMMLYFVRADRLSDLQDLRAYLESDEDFVPDVDVYAEAGGYLLDKGSIEDARTVLLKAHDVSTTTPEIDYNLARLYREIDEPAEEGRALRNTLANLDKAERTPEHIFMEIDTRRRNGDWLYREERELESVDEYARAIELTEQALTDRTLAARPELGLAYAGLGNVRYYVDNDYDAALELYELSRERLLVDHDVDYRIGYIRYAQGDYALAVTELVPLQEKLPQNWNILFAAATSLFQRGDYFAAEGYYRRLVDRLLARRDAIRDLRPESNPEHFTLVNLLLKARNNLGITFYEEGRMRGGRGRELTRALVEITEAAQYLDVLSRDPETLERSEAKNLAYLNANALQHPGTGFDPTIYDRIPRDPEAERF